VSSDISTYPEEENVNTEKIGAKRYDTNDNEKSPEGGGYLPATY
jgi:hypothetical protein